MTKTQNNFGQYVLSAEKGMTLTDGEIYTKVYISPVDIDETVWAEVNDAEVPVVEEELTETEQKAKAYDILMGVGE
jgi:hypothetical protein